MPSSPTESWRYRVADAVSRDFAFVKEKLSAMKAQPIRGASAAEGGAGLVPVQCWQPGRELV